MDHVEAAGFVVVGPGRGSQAQTLGGAGPVADLVRAAKRGVDALLLDEVVRARDLRRRMNKKE